MTENNQGVEKKNINDASKKRSFFGGNLDIHAKDLLDFRYNTQEEIDKLNEEMMNTGNQIDENDNQNFNKGNKQESEPDFEISSEGINDSTIDNPMDDDYQKENSPIEGEIVEDEDYEQISDDIINNENSDEIEDKSNEENSVTIDDVEDIVDKKEDEDELSDSAKFFDPFELDLDEEEEKEEDSEGDGELFDPFGLSDEEDSEEPDEESEIDNEEDVTDDEESISEEILDKNEETDNEDEKNFDENIDNGIDDNEDEVDDEEDEVDDEEDEVGDGEDEVDDEEDEVDNEEDEVDDEEDEVDDEEDEVGDGEDEVDDEENEGIFNEEKDDEINDDSKQDYQETAEEEDANLNNENLDENDNIISNSLDSDQKDKKKGFKNTNVKDKPAVGNTITEEIQLEQGQDIPDTENEEEYQPSDEEIFEREPEFFADDELSQQFLELVQNVRKIFRLERKDGEENPYFKILGSKTADSTLEYLFYLIEEEEEPVDLYIKKVETNHEAGEEIEHLVQFSYNEDKELNIFVDEVILYEKINKADSDSAEYNDTKAILEKFIFLTRNYYKELESELDKQREEKQKKRQLQQIFKGF